MSLSLSHWYPGSGVVLDCIDSWSLHPYILLKPGDDGVEHKRQSKEQVPTAEKIKLTNSDSASDISSGDNYVQDLSLKSVYFSCIVAS